MNATVDDHRDPPLSGCRRRVAVVIHALHDGGAEKTAAQLANYWAGRGTEVTLITLASAASDAFALDPRIRRVGLDVMSNSRSWWDTAFNTWNRVQRLRGAIVATEATCVVSLTEKMNVLTVLACRPVGWTRCSARLVICERTDPRFHDVGRLWSWLRRRLYHRADAIVAQTHAARDFLLDVAGSTPVEVIPNCVWPEAVPSRIPDLLQRRQRIVGLGRLAPEKGFDVLIEAFRQIQVDFPDWDLAIAGEGPLRESLQRQIEAGGLQSQVQLLGWLSEPQSVLLDSQVFALSSRYEGFPNSLLEAMACGLAAVSFDCESGPREIIRSEVDGLLIPPGNSDALAAALRRLLSDPALRLRLGSRAREVCHRFHPGAILARWDQLLGPG